VGYVAIVMVMKNEYQIQAPDDFISVIEDILSSYKKSGLKNLVIALQGDLGAGKTAFTQQLAKYLGVTESVTSPTFIIMKQYEIDSEDFDSLVHIDAYRIEDESEIEPLRLKEIVEQPNIVVCIEWPEIIPTVVPESAFQVEIYIGKDDIRTVQVSQNIAKLSK